MALTAIATRATKKAVFKRLSLTEPYVVAISLHKPNIMYKVREKGYVEEVVKPIVQLLCKQEIPTDNKVIIFCRTYDECSHVFVIQTTSGS